MGYARKFSTDAWAKRSSSCPTSSGTVSAGMIFQLFPTGPVIWE